MQRRTLAAYQPAVRDHHQRVRKHLHVCAAGAWLTAPSCPLDPCNGGTCAAPNRRIWWSPSPDWLSGTARSGGDSRACARACAGAAAGHACGACLDPYPPEHTIARTTIAPPLLRGDPPLFLAARESVGPPRPPGPSGPLWTPRTLGTPLEPRALGTHLDPLGPLDPGRGALGPELTGTKITARKSWQLLKPHTSQNTETSGKQI